MTGVFRSNVGINQAYFLSDANIGLQLMLIFVGITRRFPLIDTT